MEPGVLDPLDHQLRDAVPAGERRRLSQIMIDQQYLHFAPVTRINRAWCVHNADSEPMG
jgi:hypothetical protein